MTIFADRLKSLRLEQNLSQEELAAKLKVSRSCIGNYEKSVRFPNHEDLDAIADFFNVDTDFLRGKTDRRNKYTHDLLTDNEAVLIEIYRRDPEARAFLDQYLKVVQKEE